MKTLSLIIIACAIFSSMAFSQLCSPSFKEIHSYPVGSIFEYSTYEYHEAPYESEKENTYKIVKKRWSNDTLYLTLAGYEVFVSTSPINNDTIQQYEKPYYETIFLVDSTEHVLNQCDSVLLELFDEFYEKYYYSYLLSTDSTKYYGGMNNLYYKVETDSTPYLDRDIYQYGFYLEEAEYKVGYGEMYFNAENDWYGERRSQTASFVDGVQRGTFNEKALRAIDSIEAEQSKCSPTLRDMYGFKAGSYFTYTTEYFHEAPFYEREDRTFLVSDMWWDEDTLYMVRAGYKSYFMTDAQMQMDTLDKYANMFYDTVRVVDSAEHLLNQCDSFLVASYAHNEDRNHYSYLQVEGDTKSYSGYQNNYVYNENDSLVLAETDPVAMQYFFNQAQTFKTGYGETYYESGDLWGWVTRTQTASIIDKDTIGAFSEDILSKIDSLAVEKSKCSPTLRDIYSFDVGSVFHYEEKHFGEAPFIYIIEKQYTVTGKIWNGDTLTYTIEGMQEERNYNAIDYYPDAIPTSTYWSLFNRTITIIDSVDHPLNTCPEDTVVADLDCNVFDMPTAYALVGATDTTKILGTDYTAYLKDSENNLTTNYFGYEYGQYQYHEKYQTGVGLIRKSEVNNWVGLEITLLGSEINGVIKGDISKNTYAKISETACKEYMLPSGKKVTENGNYFDTIPNTAGYDSIVQISLTIKTVDTRIERLQPDCICPDMLTVLSENATTVQWMYCNGDIINGATEKNFTVVKTAEYAAIITEGACTDTSECIPATYVAPCSEGIRKTIEETICAGSIYTSPSGRYEWKKAGTYTDTLQTTTGCDSVVEIKLDVYTVDTRIERLQPDCICPDMLTVLSENATAVQWMYCNGDIIDGATEMDYTVAQSAEYAAIITEGTCTDTSECVYAEYVEPCPGGILETRYDTICKGEEYISPTGTYTWTESGTYTDTILEISSCKNVIEVVLTVIEINNDVELLYLTGEDYYAHITIVEQNTDFIQWMYCNGEIIPEATENVFAPSNSAYYAAIINKAGCVDTTECVHLIISDIEELQTVSFSYNPKTGEGVIDNTMSTPLAYRVINIMGSVIIETTDIEDSTCEFHIEDSPGIYILEIVVNGESKYYKLVKE